VVMGTVMPGARLQNIVKLWEQEVSCKIWGFHGGDYEEWCLLGCYAVWLLYYIGISSQRTSVASCSLCCS
jgi:hypothetical protein